MSNINDVTALKAITNIIIDEEAFDRSVRQLEELVSDIKKLEKDVDDMLADLIRGYNTPSGRKFINACRYYVVVPLAQQDTVITQVMKNLQLAKNGYQSVFEEYRQLVDYMTE